MLSTLHIVGTMGHCKTTRHVKLSISTTSHHFYSSEKIRHVAWYWINLFLRKFRILSWEIVRLNYKLQNTWFLLGVSTDAIQEHYYTGAKIVGSFYNNAEYSFIFMKITFLNQANNFKPWRYKILMREVRSMTIHEDFKDCKTLIP